jgi:hypothetical protein
MIRRLLFIVRFRPRPLWFQSLKELLAWTAIPTLALLYTWWKVSQYR